MSLLTPCAGPVVHSLPNTGLDVWLMTGVGGVVVAGGIAAVIMAKTLKGKLTALALPLVAAAGIALGNPQPSYAQTGAPTVASDVVIVGGTSADPQTTARFELASQAQFNNPENCGTLRYQWQASNGSDWVTDGDASAFSAARERPYCTPGYQERLLVTLTNSSGSATSTSNILYTCS